jgi:Ca-activated chloride channel family protein
MDGKRTIRIAHYGIRNTEYAVRIAYSVLRIPCLRLLLPLLVVLLVLSACAPAVVRHNEAGNERFAESAYEEALSEYRLAQVDEPDLAEPYYNAANAHNRQREVEGALAQTEQALKTADPALAAQAWYNLGNAFFDAEQWPQAIEAYKEALRLRPDDVDGKHNLELAQQKLQQQQQQQQQQSEGDQQEQQDQDQEQEQDQEQAEAPPSPEEESAASGDQEQQPTPQPSGAPQEEAQGMTEEQALQLLQALLDDSQTLQERLQEMYQVPGPAPAEDW